MTYRTGKKRTLVLEGTLELSRRGKLTPGTIDAEGNETGGDLKIARAEFTAEAVWIDPFFIGKVRVIAGTGKEKGWFVQVWDGFGGYSEFDTREIVTGGPTWDFEDNATAEYRIELDVKELIEVGEGFGAFPELDATDLEGFPAEPLIRIDGSGYRDGFGDAVRDGTPSGRSEWFEVTRPGGKARAWIRVEGSLSGVCEASTETTLSSEMAIQQLAVFTQYGAGFDTPGWCRNTVTRWGKAKLDSEDTYTRTDGITTAHAEDRSFTLEATPNVDDQSYGTLSVILAPPREYRFRQRARMIEGETGDFPDFRWQHRKEWDTEAWVPRSVPITANGPETVTKQRYYACGSSLNGVTQTGEGRDEVCPVRAWVDVESLTAKGIHSLDWRARFQLFPWPAIRTKQEPIIRLANDLPHNGTPTLSVPLLFSNLEGYRYLGFRGQGLFDWRGATYTLGEKQFKKPLYQALQLGQPGGSDPVAFLEAIDLCNPVNLPEGFEKDTRDTRYPLEIQEGEAYSPEAEKPKIDQEDEEERGWLSGIIERPETLVIETPSAETFPRAEDVSLGRYIYNETRVMRSFLGDVLGWESETDKTYLSPCLWLDADGKIVGPFPDRAHVEPISGTGEYWVYYSLANLSSFVAKVRGWTANLLPERPDAPRWTVDGETKLYGHQSRAACLETLIWDGEKWRDQRTLRVQRGPTLPDDYSSPQEYDVWAAGLTADEVIVYPGCPRPEDPYDEEDQEPFELSTSKVYASRHEGLASEGMTVAQTVNAGGAARGSGTADGMGVYRTGLPFAKNYEQLRATLLDGDTEPYEGPYRQHNRYFSRTSFPVPSRELLGIHLAASELTGRMHDVARYASGIETARFFEDGQEARRIVATGADITDAQIAVRATEELFVGFVQAGTVYETRSTSHGDYWTTGEVITMGTEVAIATDALTGTDYAAVFESSIWRCYRKLEGESWTTAGIICNQPEGRAGLIVNYSVDRALVFTVLDGSGERKRYRSTDGGDTWGEIA